MKYIGSKTKIAGDLIPIIQNYISTYGIKLYVEPFVGGFNVIDKVKCDKKVGSDIDNLAIDLVKSCVNNPNLLTSLPDLPTKEHYYDVRDNKDKYDTWYRSAILLFGSYNARVYGGCYGAFAKTKDGTIRNYFQESKRNFEKQLPLLKDIEIHCRDYKDVDVCDALIYCDIPYKDSIGYVNEFNHEEFYNWCEQQSNKGNIVLISEYDMPSDRFKCVWEKSVITHQNNRNKIDKVEKLYVCKNNTNNIIDTHITENCVEEKISLW